MLRKKVTTLALLIAFSNIGFVSAIEKKTNEIQLNKEYTYNVQKGNNNNLVEFNINVPSKGTLHITKSKFDKDDGDFNLNDVFIKITNEETGDYIWFSYEGFEFNLDKGNYRVAIYTEGDVPTKDNSLKYRFNFTPNENVTDLELTYSSDIELNKKLNGEFLFITDEDKYYFVNDKERKVRLKLKLDDITNSYTKEELENVNLLYDVWEVDDDGISDVDYGYEHITNACKNGLEVEFTLPKGEMLINLRLDSNYESKIKDVKYEFILEDVSPTISQDKEGHWTEKQINDFISKGYINGYSDGTFKPNNQITRAEFVTLLNKYFGLSKSSGKVFNDTNNHWAKNAIDIAVTNGICNGVSSTEFKPNEPLTREQASVMIANYKKIKDSNLDKIAKLEDSNNISNWAKSSVEGMIEKGYMNGYSDNTFKPKENITRAEAVVTLDRIK